MKRSILKNRQIPRRLSAFLGDQDGGMAVVIVLLLPVLFGFAGLAVDVGHMYVEKSQLKNAADAGALAGARALVPYTPTKQPDWANGTKKAQEVVGLNYGYYYENKNHPLAVSQAFPGSAVPLSEGPLLSQATPCYWNLDSNTTKPASVSPTSRDVAAMHVQVSKTAGQNGGPVEMYLGKILPGVQSAYDVSATSVAMISFPQVMGKGGLKPLAATTELIDKYWNTGDTFNIGDENKNDPSINPAMWTSLTDDVNSNDYTKKLIDGAIPGTASIGDPIYLQPGLRGADYGPNGMGQFINQTVFLPIVAPPDLVNKTMPPVKGFVAFHITGFNQGGKYLTGYFDKDYVITDNQSVGPPNLNIQGPSNPPMLVF